MDKLIPTLRFQEFKEELKCIELQEFTQWSSGGTPSKDNLNYWNGNIPWISASSMKGIEYCDSELKITLEGLKNGSRLAKKGDLLLLVRGSMLFNKIPIGITSRDVAFNQDLKAIRINENVSFSEFILQWFFHLEPKILNMVTGTGIGAGKLDLIDLKTLKINLPSLPEQQKIASFLTAVDDKLALLKEKKNKLEQYKKGMMQKIFSQELRFKDDASTGLSTGTGNEYPEWEEKRLGEVGEIITGKTPNTNKSELWNGDIQFVTPTDMNGDKFQKITARSIKELSTTKVLPKNSIMYTCIASIGKMSISIYPCITNQQINSIIVDEKYNFQFIYYGLLNLTDFIKSTQSNTTLPLINKTEFSRFSLHIPCFNEQTKIANFLTIIDEKIEVVEKQIQHTEEYKKGLLQGMFC